jgi:hypothetical protein
VRREADEGDVGDKLTAQRSVRRTMTNLLAQAVNCDDADRAASIIQGTLAWHRERRRRQLLLPEDLAERPRAARSHYRRMAADRGSLSGLVTDARCFPPPWSADETDACFIVRDANGQAARLRLFRGRAGTPRGGQAAHTRRGPAHRRQHRQAAGGATSEGRRPADRPAPP